MGEPVMKKSVASIRDENIEFQWTAAGFRMTFLFQEPEPHHWVVQLPREPIEEASGRLIEHLKRDSLQLAALGEHGGEAISDLLRMPYAEEREPQRPLSAMVSQSDCPCGQIGCNHIQEALKTAEGSWRAASAIDRLAWLGWTAESLLDAVLDCWSSSLGGKDAEAELKRFAARLDTPAYRSKEGEANLAEWLAEMAHNGHLHQPGPELHDVEVSLTPLRLASQAPVVQPWIKLLPGVPGAAEGLSLVIEQASRNAERLAKPLRASKS